MKRTLKALNRILAVIVILSATAAMLRAQTYPVMVNTQVMPPYSPFLNDYTEPGMQRLMVNFVLRDPTLPEYRCKLRLTIEGVGVTIRTKQSFIPRGPLVLPGGGIPLQLYGEDLAEYFLPGNLDFAGISRSQYEKGAKLPEGVYRFTIEVLDFNRGTVVSNKGTAMAWIILNDPPLLNLPRNDTKVTIMDPTNIAFNWTPRHTASPNSAFTAEYTFRLVEIWPITRNPYDAFLSQQPLYETTTNLTQVVYTMSEPALIPGRKYAWQVQAKDTEGRDLFKNQGKSEVYVFQYGDALGAPEGLYLQTANPTSLVVRWEQNVAGTDAVNYRVRYRPHSNRNTEAWYEDKTADQWRAISSLQPSTEYEVQVRAEQATQNSEYSPVKVFKTAAPGANEFVCKADVPVPPTPTGGPAFRLGVNDTIHAGGYNVLVRELTANANGVYSGSGMAIVPWFAYAKVSVTFKNIGVNDQFWLTSGEIKSVWNPDSKFLIKSPTKTDPANAPDVRKVPITVAQTETLIEITGAAIADVSKNSDGDIEIHTTDGETKVLEKGKSYSIVDEVGNGYVVDKAGNITKTTATDAREAAGRGDRNYTIALKFMKGNGKLGFDEKKYDALAPYYQQLEGGTYVAWKSVTSTQSDPVTAVLEGSGIDAKRVRFEVNGAPLIPAASGSTYTLTLAGKPGGTVEELLGLYAASDTAKDNVLGQLNLVSYDQVHHDLVVVPVNNTQLPGGFSETTLSTELSRIYGQAVTSWNVRIDPSLEVTLGVPFDDGETGLLSNYTGDMKKVINAYGTMAKNTYYLFLVDKPKSGNTAIGYMPRSKQAGFIFAGNLTASTAVAALAHEVGHGAFNLKHTFGEFSSMSKGSTDNLMDYNNGTTLCKYQWDHIHDPQAVIPLFDGDEEGQDALIVRVDADTEFIAWGVDDDQTGDFKGGKAFVLSNGSVIVFKKGIEVTRTDNGHFKIGDKEYTPMYLVDAKGAITEKFTGLYDVSILPSVVKSEGGGWKTADLDKSAGWYKPEDYQMHTFIRSHTQSYSRALLSRTDIDVDKAVQISKLLERFTDEMFADYQQKAKGAGGDCGYMSFDDKFFDYSKCWDTLIQKLEDYLNRSENVITSLIAEVDKPKIDRSLVKDKFDDLDQTNYGMLTADQRIKLLSYLVTGVMIGDYPFFGGDEGFAIKIVKNTPPEQVPALITGLEAKPLVMKSGAKAGIPNSSLIYNLEDRIDDGIFGLTAGNYSAIMKEFKDLMLKSVDFEDRLMKMLSDDLAKRTVKLHAYVHKEVDESDFTYGGTTMELLSADWITPDKGVDNSQIKFTVGEVETRIEGLSSSSISLPTGEGNTSNTLSPFEMVALTNYSDLSIVNSATEAEYGQTVFVPVLFIKYIDIKDDNDKIQDFCFNVLDAATLVTGTGAIVKLARATNEARKWVRYGKIALRALEVANAAGNLTLRNMEAELQDTTFREAVEWSDKAMLAIGALQLIRGGVKGIPKALSAAKSLSYTFTRQTAYGFVKAIIKVESKLAAKAAESKAARQMLELKNKIVIDWMTRHGEDLEAIIRTELGLARAAKELADALKNADFKKIYDALVSGALVREFPNELSIAEEAIYKYYTTELYYKFNQALIQGSQAVDIVALERLLNNTLAKLAASPGKYFRGIGKPELDILRKLKPGDKYIPKNFYSSTYDEEIAWIFFHNNLRKTGEAAMVRIVSKTGKDIHKYSTAFEAEILHGSKTEFVFKGLDIKKDYITNIDEVTFEGEKPIVVDLITIVLEEL